ncbi:hypothetical protein [Methanosarcina sp. KYL-1]|uniref:hypothetical protein n=1 Tax=Methanosarcina sp. KYL-1 TaxID=2602068 RepID=UPI0021014EE5|nr:hypothetical protein [Methanosarcina sp. KYL-1]
MRLIAFSGRCQTSTRFRLYMKNLNTSFLLQFLPSRKFKTCIAPGNRFLKLVFETYFPVRNSTHALEVDRKKLRTVLEVDRKKLITVSVD